MKIWHPPYAEDVPRFTVDEVSLSHGKDGFKLYAQRRRIADVLGESLVIWLLEKLGHPCCENGLWGKIFINIERRLPTSCKHKDCDDGLYSHDGDIAWWFAQLPTRFYKEGKHQRLWEKEVIGEDVIALHGSRERFRENWFYLFPEDDEDEDETVFGHGVQ